MSARRFAGRLLDHADRIMPRAHRPWVSAMRAELNHIPGPMAAAAFVLGCVWASYAQRIQDMFTITVLTRWTLAGLALAWAVFAAAAAVLLAAIKTRPDITPADLGTDPGTAQTLVFVQAYPAWELAVFGLIAGLIAAGAVQLARRHPMALPLFVLGVGAAIALALQDLRLPDPGADRPMGSVAELLVPLLCLVPVWWLSRRAPDLKTAN